jgi:hypothetical protein
VDRELLVNPTYASGLHEWHQATEEFYAKQKSAPAAAP